MAHFEVFLKRPGKEPYTHAGSLEAADAELAAVLARECYARRAEGLRMWIVDRADIVALDDESFFAPALDKWYRFNDGSVVAAERKRRRADAPGR